MPAIVREGVFRSHEGRLVVLLLPRVVPHLLCPFLVSLEVEESSTSVDKDGLASRHHVATGGARLGWC
jgi:hypothetical protein